MGLYDGEVSLFEFENLSNRAYESQTPIMRFYRLKMPGVK